MKAVFQKRCHSLFVHFSLYFSDFLCHRNWGDRRRGDNSGETLESSGSTGQSVHVWTRADWSGCTGQFTIHCSKVVIKTV